ncbi:MAG TPA: hypothetical protein VGA78_00955, partial [Gemmatimonadales bacterium]
MSHRSALLLMLVASACFQPARLARDDSATVLAKQILEAPDPTLLGPLPVRTLYYGSGNDRRRRAFKDSVT